MILTEEADDHSARHTWKHDGHHEEEEGDGIPQAPLEHDHEHIATGPMYGGFAYDKYEYWTARKINRNTSMTMTWWILGDVTEAFDECDRLCAL
jgi:hypothetical protein